MFYYLDPALCSNLGHHAQYCRFEPREPRRDPRATLYRYAASIFDSACHSGVTLLSFEKAVSKIYQYLLRLPVQTFSWPHKSVVNRLRERCGEAVVVSFLGHQRQTKGFHLVPDILRELGNLSGVEFLVHNAAPGQMRMVHEEVRSLASSMPNLAIDETVADGQYWTKLLEASDLVVCPYYPPSYAASHSALLAECIANEIPCVIPAGTILASMASQYGRSALEFSEWNAKTIASSVRIAVENYEQYSRNALSAAKNWAKSEGAEWLIEQLTNR